MIYTILSTVLIVFNVLLALIVLYFMQKSKDKASIVGFSTMFFVYAADILFLLRGMMI